MLGDGVSEGSCEEVIGFSRRTASSSLRVLGALERLVVGVGRRVTDQNFQTAPPARPKPTTNLKARSGEGAMLGTAGANVIVELRARGGEPRV